MMVPYQRTSFFQFAWMFWGLFGFLFLYGDLGNSFFEIFILFLYVLIIISSLLAFFNRQNGVNHRIEFQEQQMVVPFPMMLWYWQERTIRYRDISQISFVESWSPGNQSIPYDIFLHLPYERYRILCSKLTEEQYAQVFKLLKQHVGFEFEPSLAPNAEAKGSEQGTSSADPAAANTGLNPINPWRFRLLMMKLMGLVWSLSSFMFSTPYLWLFEGNYFVYFTIIFVVWISVVLHWLIPKTAFANRWEKSVFHMLMALYLGIGFLQSLLGINGYFDQSKTTVSSVKIMSQAPTRGPGISCYFVQAPKQLVHGRQMASVADAGPAPIEVCNPKPTTWSVGSDVQLHIRQGALGEAWLTDIQYKGP